MRGCLPALLSVSVGYSISVDIYQMCSQIFMRYLSRAVRTLTCHVLPSRANTLEGDGRDGWNTDTTALEPAAQPHKKEVISAQGGARGAGGPAH